MNQQENMTVTKREFECLFWLSRGFTAKEIAKEMKISSRTVECYLCNIRSKTHIHRKSQLISFFRQVDDNKAI